jgi:hypothetical protein
MSGEREFYDKKEPINQKSDEELKKVLAEEKTKTDSDKPVFSEDDPTQTGETA